MISEARFFNELKNYHNLQKNSIFTIVKYFINFFSRFLKFLPNNLKKIYQFYIIIHNVWSHR